MFKNKWNINYFSYCFTVAIILSFFTLLNSFFSSQDNTRLIYFFFYYLFFNFSVMIGLSLVLNASFGKGWNKIKNFVFLFMTSFYALFYVFSSITFFMTGQALRIQGALFTYAINPFYIIFITFLGIFALLIIVSVLLYNKINFCCAQGSLLKRERFIFAFSFLMLIFCVLFLHSYLDFENKIVSNYNGGDIIFVYPDYAPGKNVLNVTSGIERPNVIFILLESVSSNKISYYGYGRNLTSNIDELAKEGIVFRNAYTTATHSDYAQPAYLSSQYVLVNGYRNFFTNNNGHNFIWDVFKDENYSTYYISSQDDSWAGMGNYFNFSSLDLYWHSLSDGETDYGTGLGKKDFDYKTIDKAISVLEDHSIESGKPFFMYLNFQATHAPLVYPYEYNYYFSTNSSGGEKLSVLDKIDRYDNALRYVDIQIGRLVNYLKATGEINKTVIVLSSDHGDDLLNLHNSYGHGLSVYDDELKVPLIIYSPLANHTEINNRVSHIDLIPTALSFLNITTNRSFFGNSMTERERFFFYSQNNMYLIGMIKDDIKIIIDMNRNLAEAYNLTQDPGEKHNLIAEKTFDEYLLELLMWHHCQINYFIKDIKPEALEKYCNLFV